MLDRDITSANASVAMFSEFFNNVVPFVQFGADNAWSQDNYEFLEHRMGVDGHVAIGFTPVEKTITFTFEANSPTLDSLNILYKAMEVDKKPYYSNIVITIPALRKKFYLRYAYLTSYKVIPDGDKTLSPVEATFTFESVDEETFA